MTAWDRVAAILLMAAFAVPWSLSSTALIDLDPGEWLVVAAAVIGLGGYLWTLTAGRGDPSWFLDIGAVAFISGIPVLMWELATATRDFDALTTVGFLLWNTGTAAALLAFARMEHDQWVTRP